MQKEEISFRKPTEYYSSREFQVNFKFRLIPESSQKRFRWFYKFKENFTINQIVS